MKLDQATMCQVGAAANQMSRLMNMLIELGGSRYLSDERVMQIAQASQAGTAVIQVLMGVIGQVPDMPEEFREALP